MRRFIDIINEATAFHGSARDFDAFDGEFVGTGDGALTFGWGIYLASSKQIARMFVKRGTGKMFEVDMPSEDELLDWNKPLAEQSSHVKQALDRINYVELRQKAHDEEVVSGYGDDAGLDTGEEIYGLVCSVQPGPDFGAKDYTRSYMDYKKRCSMLFLKAGIAGIKYRDVIQGRSHNYVIFDPSRVQIKKKL